MINPSGDAKVAVAENYGGVMGIDKPGNGEENIDKGDNTAQQASENLIEDKNKSDAKPASAQDQQRQQQDTSLKVLPRIDMYQFHQGGAARATENVVEPGKEPKVENKTKPEQTVDAKPQEVKPGEVKPQEQKEGDAKPQDAKPPEKKEGDANPQEAKPQESTEPQDGMSKAERDHINAYRQKLEKDNFALKAIEKGWGPYQSLEAMVKEGKIKMTPAEMKKEAERIRNRDFEELGRQHYKVGETPQRWSNKEMDKMVQDELKTFRATEEKRVAAEKKAAEDRQRAEAEKQLRDQTAAALEKHVPSQDKLQSAAKGIGLNVSDQQMKEFRDRLKEHTFKEVARGTMKPEDLERPMPRVGGVFVAMGAVNEDQLNKALQHQDEMKKNGQKPPQLGDVLKEQLKGNKEALARLDMASKFYDKLFEEVTGKPRVVPTETKTEAPKPAEQKVDPKLKVRR